MARMVAPQPEMHIVGKVQNPKYTVRVIGPKPQAKQIQRVLQQIVQEFIDGVDFDDLYMHKRGCTCGNNCNGQGGTGGLIFVKSSESEG